MSIGMGIAIFLGSLGLSLVSSLVLAAGIDRIGARLGLAAGLFGVVAALGANAPEISSAVAATAGGHHDLGLGVVLGSNVFNLAALLGGAALAAGRVEIGRPQLALNATAAVLLLGVVSALVLGSVGPWPAVGLAAAVFVPYVVLVGLRPRQIGWLTPPGPVRDFFRAALDPGAAAAPEPGRPGSRTELLAVVPALAAIVLASVGMVNSAVALGGHWGVGHRVIGTLILATLTGIPNVIAAVRLAVQGRGPAVVSEALNSNTLNLLAGVCLPAVTVGLGAPSGATLSDLGWLAGMTVVAVALTAYRGHLGRWGGGALVALYCGFVGWVVFW